MVKRMVGFLTTPTPRELSLLNLGEKKYLLRPATLENYLCENVARTLLAWQWWPARLRV